MFKLKLISAKKLLDLKIRKSYYDFHRKHSINNSKRGVTHMAVSSTETIGFANQFNQFLTDNKTSLQDKGLDVTNWITNTNALKDDAVVQLGKQDELDAASKAQTQVAKTAVKLLYTTTSTRLDAAIGVLGKSTPLAKEVRKLRSSLIKQAKKKAGDPNNS